MRLVRASSAPGHSPLAVELLRAVVEAGEIRASDLASELFVTKTSISRYVNEMVRGGLLRAAPRSERRTSTSCSVSAVGRRELEEREARRSALLRDLCQNWPTGDVATLTKLLQRLNDGINATAQRDCSLASVGLLVGHHRTSLSRSREVRDASPKPSSKRPEAESAKLSPWVKAP